MTELKQSNNAACDKKTPVCAVIGEPVGHSLSPLIHTHFANQCGINLNYIKIEGSEKTFEQQVTDFFKGGGLGLNVTTPFKEKAFQMALHHEPMAKLTKVANTLWVNKKGELCADNTDGAGLVFSLKQHMDLSDKHLLLLGAGGAAKGVIPALLNTAIASLTLANRTYEKLNKIKRDFPIVKICDFNALKNDYDIIINATTSSLNNVLPSIPAEIIKGILCVDMFYDLKKETVFVEWTKKEGAFKSIDGLEMLVGQAEKSFERWHNEKIEAIKTLKYLRGLNCQHTLGK